MFNADRGKRTIEFVLKGCQMQCGEEAAKHIIDMGQNCQSLKPAQSLMPNITFRMGSAR